MAINATNSVSTAVKAATAAVHGAAKDAQVFHIPTQTEADATPPTSPVAEVSGEVGIIQGATALSALEYGRHQHPMATVRRPGVIAVDQDMGKVITEVNRVKQELRTAMSAFGRTGWDNWRGRIPAWRSLNRLQAYREWHWLGAPVRKVGFSWAGHTHSVEPIRIAALCRRLSRQYSISGHPHIAAELDYLAGFDGNEVVVIRKPIAPTPIANVAFADGRRRTIKTALPMIVAGDLPKITPLADFNPEKKGRSRDDQAIERLLVAYWHVWRYQAPHRFTLPADPVSARLTFDGDELSVRVGQQTEAVVMARGQREMVSITASIKDTRGPVPETPALDIDDTIRIVAANRAHVYLLSSQNSVWRVPVGDLEGLAQEGV